MKKLCAILVVLIIATASIAQNRNLNDIRKNFSEEYAQLESQGKIEKEDKEGKEGKEGDGLMQQFRRWEYIMKSRTYPSGIIPDGTTQWREWERYQSRHAGQFADLALFPQWQQVGTSAVPSFGGGAGHVNVIRFDPVNTNIIKTDTMPAGNYADVNGIKMYYEIHGEGKPLVLIHGGGSTIETNYGTILPLFAKHYKVIAVELQAHGHTSDRNAPETFEQDADDVAALLKQLNISKANILGFSNGGNTTMQIAIRHPELINKIVIASAFYQREGMMPGFFDMMKNASLDNMPQPLQNGYLKINPDTVKLRNMHDKDRDRMLAFKDWKDADLESIKAPALIISGDKDVVLTEHAVKMSKLIPNAELMIFPATHGEYLGEICTVKPGSSLPAATVAIVKEFLDK